MAKQDFFTSNNIKHIDYKDIEVLKRFLNPNGRILTKKRTNINAKNQRQLSQAIKRARFMGLLPFIAS
ncbi:30S ribosomal protein S18 [Candidatus Nomurabacteria bacterium RIFCSPLOWO2_01_FULL_33_24]|uniref:Small ribosomal subunit protein bS18 n=1 Tax=Candidatus Nomurabacteria bacterium RIFCSPLOWO2_01_FULL_33_24 TaxID=1801765 RepID=A0A1F6X1H6_9BACT|nr:MAG: 30S ribosomal protein S18 [Candidatus Nomurabacteria bacterium RIFCSPLOWO2_01_FULL_33_24]